MFAMSPFKRMVIQTAAALAQNPFLQNLWQGTIFKGDSKYVCAPGLNCWSCPAAGLSCPIGALQTVATGAKFSISFYVIGFLLIVGVAVGRLVCGFLCLFGFLQDLLFKIPVPKIKIPRNVDRILRKGKYLVLIVLVLLLPAVVTNALGLGEPWFCKFLCPAGTVEAGVPLVATQPTLQAMIGELFTWKMAIAVAILLGAVFISRPFCKYLCPLGAIYGLLNKVSILRLKVDGESCTQCGRCVKKCPMGVDVWRDVERSAECIRCGQCKSACLSSAISWSTGTVSIKTSQNREHLRG